MDEPLCANPNSPPQSFSLCPSKIVCVAKNYRAHAAELGSTVPEVPTFFLKPPSALQRHRGHVVVPSEIGAVEYEGELAVVIKHPICQAEPVGILDLVLGYTCANDITARGLQSTARAAGMPWTQSKGFDGFCPVGPRIVTDVDPDQLNLLTHVNGHVRQRDSTASMVFSVAEILAAISKTMTLSPGDLVLTGTPAGVGGLEPGDEVSVTIDPIGTLTTSMVAPRSTN